MQCCNELLLEECSSEVLLTFTGDINSDFDAAFASFHPYIQNDTTLKYSNVTLKQRSTTVYQLHTIRPLLSEAQASCR